MYYELLAKLMTDSLPPKVIHSLSCPCGCKHPSPPLPSPPLPSPPLPYNHNTSTIAIILVVLVLVLVLLVLLLIKGPHPLPPLPSRTQVATHRWHVIYQTNRQNHQHRHEGLHRRHHPHHPVGEHARLHRPGPHPGF